MEVMIVVKGPHKLSEVSQRLQAAGLSEVSLFENIGVILGTVEESLVDSLRAVEGVTSVEKEPMMGTQREEE